MSHTKKTLLSLNPTPFPLVAMYWAERADATIELWSDPVLYFGLVRVETYAGECRDRSSHFDSAHRECDRTGRYTTTMPLTLDGAEDGAHWFGCLYPAEEDENFLGVAPAGSVDLEKEWLLRAQKKQARRRQDEARRASIVAGRLSTDGAGRWSWRSDAPASWIAVDRRELEGVAGLSGEYFRVARKEGCHPRDLAPLVAQLNRRKYVYQPAGTVPAEVAR